jgi:uncharacterized protein YraI
MITPLIRASRVVAVSVLLLIAAILLLSAFSAQQTQDNPEETSQQSSPAATATHTTTPTVRATDTQVPATFATTPSATLSVSSTILSTTATTSRAQKKTPTSAVTRTATVSQTTTISATRLARVDTDRRKTIPGGTVNESNLNIRTGPGTDYARKFQAYTLNAGDQIEILSHATGAGCNVSWFEIRLDDESEGWVCSAYVDFAAEQVANIPANDTYAYRKNPDSRTATQRYTTRNYPDMRPQPPLPLHQRFTPQTGDNVTYLTPGALYIQRETDDPLKIHVLLFDLTAPEFELKPALGDGWLSGRTRTSYMVKQNEALAGINGDLFADRGNPQGLMIIDSHVIIPPKHRATFAWHKDGSPFIGYFTDSWTWDAEVVAADGSRRTLMHLNHVCSQGDLCLFNEFNKWLPNQDGDVKVLLDDRGEVVRITQNIVGEIPKGIRVLQGTAESAEWLREHMAISDTVDIEVRTNHPLDDYTQAISGGPIILQDGEFVQDCYCKLNDCRDVSDEYLDDEPVLCEDFDTSWKESHYAGMYMPRTGVGYDRWKQTLIVAVVDGYQLGFSRGMLQEEFADLLYEFGAYTAMELDGGGSSTMVINDNVVNHPSDDTGERYVANALLFFWHEPSDSGVSKQVRQMWTYLDYQQTH